jgi:hypothetical protein
MVDVRKGMPSVQLDEQEFKRRFLARFYDPAFEPLQTELERIADAAWDGYSHSRKAPRTVKAGPGFADPDYDISVEWLAAKQAIDDAQKRHDDVAGSSRVLLVNGSSRSEHTCPGEMSKSWRLLQLADEVIRRERGFECDILDLSILTSEFNRVIYPCKSCVSTAMPLCHWPCSCYPNHSLQQNNDWMSEIYPRWVAAHCRAGELVSGVVGIQIDDGPAGLRRRRQHGPKFDARQRPEEGERDRACRLGFSASSRRPHLRRICARRFSRRRKSAPHPH